MGTVRGRWIAAALAAALGAGTPPTVAEENPGAEEAGWVCSSKPVLKGSDALPKVPKLSAAWRLPEDSRALVAALERAIWRFHDAKLKEQDAFDRLRAVIRGPGCEGLEEAFDSFLEVQQGAFDKRVKEMPSFPPKALLWETPRARPSPSEATSEPDPHDWLGLSGACRPPGAPTPLKAPAIPDSASAEQKARLAALAAETDAFNRARRDQHAGLLAMLPLQEAFDCREVLTSYDRLMHKEAAGFREHRRWTLSAYAARSLRWEPR